MRWVVFLAMVAYLCITPVGVLMTWAGPSVGAQPAAALLLFLAAGAFVAVARGGIRWAPETLVVFGLFLYAGVTLLWTPEPGTAARAWLYRWHILLPAALVVPTVAPELRMAGRQRVLALFVLFAVLSVAVAGTGAGAALTRLSPAESYNPSWFGAYCALGILLGLWLLAADGRVWVKAGAAGAVSFLLVGVLFAQARNAMAALLVALLGVLLVRVAGGGRGGEGRPLSPLRVAKGLAKGLAVLVLLAVGVTVVYFAVAEPVLGRGIQDLDRLRRTVTSFDTAVMTAGRIRIWSNALEMATANLLGSGYGSFPVLHARHFGIYVQSHNAFIGAWIELGILGVASFLALAFLILRRGWRHRGPGSMVVKALAFYLVALSLGNDVLGYKYFWAAWIFLFLLTDERRMETKGAAETA